MTDYELMKWLQSLQLSFVWVAFVSKQRRWLCILASIDEAPAWRDYTVGLKVN